jgi:hypothetical protein
VRRSIRCRRAVRLSAVGDPDDEDPVVVLVDLDQDPVVTSSSTAQPGQRAGQRLAQAEWVLGEHDGDELDDRHGDPVRELVELPSRR